MSGQLEQAQDSDDGEELQNISILQVRGKIGKAQVNVETEGGDEVNDVDGASDKVENVGTGEEPDEKLEGEPSIADTLNIEEGIVSIGPVLVQGPGRGVVGGLDSQVVDDGDPHVGVGLQAEGEYGGADEEDRDNPNTLDIKQHLCIGGTGAK